VIDFDNVPDRTGLNPVHATRASIALMDRLRIATNAELAATVLLIVASAPYRQAGISSVLKYPRRRLQPLPRAVRGKHAPYPLSFILIQLHAPETSDMSRRSLRREYLGPR
jgi:hypothetical protein